MSWQLIDSRDPAFPGLISTDGSASLEPATNGNAAVAGNTVAGDSVQMGSLPSDSAALEREFAALSDLPIAPRPYISPQAAVSSEASSSAPADVLVGVDDPSLFELSISDVPAVTPHPGFG